MSAALAPSGPRGLLTDAVTPNESGSNRLELLVDGVHCANCIGRIEKTLQTDPRVGHARVNLTLRKLTVDWRGARDLAEEIGAQLGQMGYPVHPYDSGSISKANQRAGQELLRALAIAGFASANVMMLAWAVWSGQAQDMGHGTQALFNWLSAMISVPALAFAGQPFFRSALGALRSGRTNMDVPISVALILTTAISMVELISGGEHVYFDSAMMLLFVLLIGRYLDYRVRARSREAIERLAMMRAVHATVVAEDGTLATIAASMVEPGTVVRVAPFEVLAVDGIVLQGEGLLDRSAVTGETLPEAVRIGDAVLAGCINGDAELVIRATKTAADSHLSSILRLVEAAQLEKGAAAMLADRLAALWTPFVHGIALLTFLGWLALGGLGVQSALLHAVTVLIIACPCAIGLAIPAVQIVAIGGLLQRGVLVRSGGALERLATVDQVVFDKTGTLTTGRPLIVGMPDDPALRQAAGALARTSRHPFSQAIARQCAAPGIQAENIVETPGGGITATIAGQPARLGRAAFCGVDADSSDDLSEVRIATLEGRGRFSFSDQPRDDAAQTVAWFLDRGMGVSLLSGDRAGPVGHSARQLGIATHASGQSPVDKATSILEMRQSGARVLMVGDGLNDAPALAAADVSASFGHGVAATQVAADFVLPAENLSSIVLTHETALSAARIVRQNLGFAAVYNITLIPLAVFGLVTPLIAAAAMSASSVIVTLNALRAQPAHNKGAP